MNVRRRRRWLLCFPDTIDNAVANGIRAGHCYLSQATRVVMMVVLVAQGRTENVTATDCKCSLSDATLSLLACRIIRWIGWALAGRTASALLVGDWRVLGSICWVLPLRCIGGGECIVPSDGC
jgi:hypothetical protein